VVAAVDRRPLAYAAVELEDRDIHKEVPEDSPCYHNIPEEQS